MDLTLEEDQDLARSGDHEPDTHQTSLTSSTLPSRLVAGRVLVKTQNSVIQTKRTENILLQIAFSIGLGSMWRFPYLCQRHGGGFILVYFFLLLLLGVPLLYMETVVGQWLRMDSVRIWKHLVPQMGGLGYVSMLACFMVSVYNSIITTWSLYYLTNSFYHPLPWTHCPLSYANFSGLSCLRTVSEQYFWYEVVLNAKVSMEEDQHLILHLTLGSFATWCLLFIIIVLGLKLSMPILIITIFLPSFFFIGFLIRCLFLEGAAAGLKSLVSLKHTSWASADLWHQAASHVLYSLGLGMGTAINISSYKAGSDNYVVAVLCVAVVNLVASLVATAIVFTVVGYWVSTSGPICVQKSILMVMELIKRGVLPQNVNLPAGTLPRPIDYLMWINSLPQHLKYQIIHTAPSCSIEALSREFIQGPGLAFSAFSEAVTILPGAPFWSIVLFLTLFMIQLTTLVKMVGSIVLPLHNAMPCIKRLPGVLAVLVCLSGFLGSLVFASEAGSYIMSLFDETLVPLTVLIVVILQNATLAWIYGASRFREEMYSDLGRLLWSSCPFLWCYVTVPGLLVLLTSCLLRLYGRMPPYYIAWNSSLGREMQQPYLQSTLGWVTVLGVVALLPLPIYPLQHWCYIQDHIASVPLETLLSKKATRPPDWPKYHSPAKAHFPERKSEASLAVNPSDPEPTVRDESEKSEWQEELTWSRRTESYSGFSLPFYTSLPSAESTSQPVSAQASAISEGPEGAESAEGGTREESFPKKPAR